MRVETQKKTEASTLRARKGGGGGERGVRRRPQPPFLPFSLSLSTAFFASLLQRVGRGKEGEKGSIVVNGIAVPLPLPRGGREKK